MENSGIHFPYGLDLVLQLTSRSSLVYQGLMDSYFRVTFRNNEKKSEAPYDILKVKSVGDSTLGPTFICLSDFIFEENPLIVDPLEEKLKERFGQTKSLHLSIYQIVSLEERGMAELKLTHDKSKLLVLSENNLSD